MYAPRAWRESSEAPKADAPGRQWWTLHYGSAKYRQRTRGRLDVNPFFWLAGRDLAPRWTSLCVLVPLLGFYACLLFWPDVLDSGIVLPLVTAYAMHQVLKYAVAAESPRRLTDDHRTGTLELLLVTPIAEDEILAGQRRALTSLFFWPIVLVLATNLGLLVCALKYWQQADALFLLVIAILGVALLFLDLHSLSLVGMWLAIKGGHHRRAVFGTLTRVMLGPWLAVAMLVLIRGIGSTVALETIICWFGVAALIDLSFANAARAGLLANLRDHTPPSSASGTDEPVTGSEPPSIEHPAPLADPNPSP